MERTLSQGRADWLLRWGIVTSTTAICSFLLGLPWGTKGITIAFTCWCWLSALPAFQLAGKLIDFSVIDVLRELIGVAAASLIMGVVVLALELKLPGSWPPVAKLGSEVAVGVLTYLVALHIGSPGPYKEFKAVIAHYRGRVRRIAKATS